MKVTSISFSSDKKLARCEQLFFYRYNEKLKPRVKKVGLFRGDIIHQLLEEYRRGKDWKKKFKQFKVEVWDKLFDEEKEQYGLNFPQQIFDLMAHYVEHWSPQDAHFKRVYVEKAFELVTKDGIPVRWKSDFIVRDKGVTVLFENKNTKKIPESNERILSQQVHAYAYLLSKVGIKIDRIVWDYVRTEKIPSPKILKDGSLSKRKIQTDQRTYLKAMKKAGIHPKGDEAIGVENFLKTLPETLSLLRVTNSPNLKVGELFVRDWVERHRRAQKITRPLRNFNRNCRYDCDYMELCMADMTGKPDRTMIIKKDFVTSIKPAVEDIK